MLGLKLNHVSKRGPWCSHGDVTAWKRFPHYPSFVKVIHQSQILMFSLTLVCTGSWAQSSVADELRDAMTWSWQAFTIFHSRVFFFLFCSNFLEPFMIKISGYDHGSVTVLLPGFAIKWFKTSSICMLQHIVLSFSPKIDTNVWKLHLEIIVEHLDEDIRIDSPKWRINTSLKWVITALANISAPVRRYVITRAGAPLISFGHSKTNFHEISNMKIPSANWINQLPSNRV